MRLKDIKINPNNPRKISDIKLQKLVQSIKEFPKMLELRPIIVNKDNVILGGNMRYKALQELGYDEISENWIKIADELTDEEARRFIIEDNVSFGTWDYEMLSVDFEVEELDDWGLEIDSFDIEENESKVKTETEKLSNLEYTGAYYEPEEKPEINLADCINLDKFIAKVDFLESLNLTESQKGILRHFAYRFIKIDFENVANYYFFNASEEEKKAIERLRLVLVDSGINGFIEDDLLRIYEGANMEIEDND